MKKIIVIILMLGLIACSSETWLPMTSFSIKVESSSQSKEIWNKLRVVVLKRGYSYVINKSTNNKSYVLGAENHVSVMLNDNTKKGFIEVVYFQSIDDGFNAFGENEFNELMFDIKETLSGHMINVEIPFVKGQAPKGLNQT